MRSLALSLSVAISLAACSSGERTPGVDVDRALAFMRELAREPRNADAIEFRVHRLITETLDRLGVRHERITLWNIDVPGIEILGRTYREPKHHAGFIESNYLMRFGPRDGKALLIMAHWDSVHGSPGATDNAAAVGVVIELARILNAQPPPHPVWLALTAHEEIGLLGAEVLARDIGGQVDLAIALDLVGGDGQLVINGASELIGRAELGWIADAARRAGVDITAPPAHRVVSRWWPQAERSDHGPFTRRGVRAVHFYNRGNDGDWIDLAYHSSRDTPERVHRERVDDLGRLLRALIDTPVPAYAGDGYWVPGTRVVVPRAVLLVVEVALILLALVMLVMSRDGLVATLVQQSRRERGAALLVGIACFAAVVVLAVVVEGSVRGTHEAPWLHAPERMVLAYAAFVAGGLGLVTRVVARRWPWQGEYRYLALAIIVLVVLGTFWLVVGAAEIAWVWLVPAGVLAIAPRLGRAGIVAIPAALVPALAILHPGQLREAAWNGFWPTALPLVVAIALLGAPAVATAAWWLRRHGAGAGPLGTLVLGVGCGLLVALGLVVAITTEPACSAAEFARFHLACERV